MKVLVINGSPKGDKSDTMHLTRAFLQGMADTSDVQACVINAVQKNIGYCKGCFACKQNGGDCVQKDDMKNILEEILYSDVFILSYPLYCYGMPAPLKAIIDRTMPLSSMAMARVGDRYVHPAQADFSRLKYVMICGCGFPNSKHNFEPAVAQFKLCFPNNHTILTVPESPMFNVPQADALTKPFLQIVRQAGREYAESESISAHTMQKLLTLMMPEEEYAKIVNCGEY